jgi:hypothetical protein
VSVALKIPLENEWVETSAVGRVGRLKRQEDRDSINRIFEAAAQEAGKMRTGQDPSIAQAGVEDSSVAPSAGD